ncbi:hypothetical protein ADK76_29255 [Streptomyces griseoflavus]|uniref:hypothetical protein n=1 Tax=Streptomyces rimosus TaxID=1927 RepID=UPI0004CC7B41|nr:hypothetical protein [Streptomyces rimosus]KOG53041.1 hypothetical protein ADK76_29255 [Streptomyces griseoflavus]
MSEQEDVLPSAPVGVPPAPPEGGDTAAEEAARLREELAQLRRERDARERREAVDGLLQRHRYVTPEIVQALGTDFPLERLEAVAGAIDRAFLQALPPSVGRGGLTPSDEGRATWGGLFRSAL